MNKKIKNMTLAAAAFVVVACGKPVDRTWNAGINIIPVPVELTVTDSTAKYTLTDKTVIVVSSPDFVQPAAYLAAKIKGATGYDIQVVETAPSTDFISLEMNPRVPVGHEGYLLKSTKDGVKIESRTPQGAFYGVQTALQLLPAEIESPDVIKGVAWEIPLVDIKDEPRFKYRGLMMDVTRHFFGVDVVKKQLDVLAMFKINRFHWHLTEDQLWAIEIKQYPKLTEIGSRRIEGDGTSYGGFYTQEQIKEVVAYAAERYIDVIPEIELPGHGLAALSAYPEYSCTGGPFKNRIIWGVEEDVYCVGNDSTFTFLENIITEVAALFPSEYFHIGGDECPKNRWKVCPKCQARAKALGLREKTDAKGAKHSVEEQLQSYAVTRMEKHLASLGKKMIGWDEILEGGLAPGALVMSWRGEGGGIAAAMQDHEAIMTPGSGGLYIDHYQGAAEVEPVGIGGSATLQKTYSYDPLPKDLPEDKHQFIIGAQTNMWTEYVLNPELLEYMLFPRVIALAEVTWSPASKKDWDSFAKRINNAYARLDYHNINYHIPMPEGTLTENVVFITDSVVVPFSNSRDLPMVYTLNGDEPTASSPRYENPIVMTKGAQIKIATVLPTGKMSKSRSINVEKQTLAPAATPTPNPEASKILLGSGMTPGVGLVAKVAEGLFVGADSYANAEFGNPVAVNYFTSRDSLAPKFDMNKPSLAVFDGYVELPEDGVYGFTTDMDELWIDGVLVISNPKLSRHGRTKAQKALAAGKHSYKLVFNNMIKDGWPNNWNEVTFRYQLPSGGDFKKVQSEMLTY